MHFPSGCISAWIVKLMVAAIVGISCAPSLAASGCNVRAVSAARSLSHFACCALAASSSLEAFLSALFCVGEFCRANFLCAINYCIMFNLEIQS
jgi:hypothetical protein